MAKKEIEYTELAKCKVQPTRNIVISSVKKRGKDVGFTLGPQLEVAEGNRKTAVFMSGAIVINDIEGLYDLRDALNISITKYEQMKE